MFGTAAVGTAWPDRARAESSASDQSDEASASHEALTSLLPDDSQLALFIDVDTLRNSKYYSELAGWIRSRSKQTEAIAKLEEEGELDLSEDISSVALGFPAATPTEIRKNQNATVALEAEFDREKMTSLIGETFDSAETREVSDDLTVHVVDQSEIAVMEGRIVVVSGDSSYRDTAWKAVRGEGTSLQDAIEKESHLERLDDNRSFWMLNRATEQTRPEQLSDLDSAVVGVRLEDGIELQLIARAADEKAGKKMHEQMKALRKQSAENPMLTTVGAMPLIDNLETSLDGTTLVASTSMTGKELDALVTSVRQLAKSRMGQSGGAGSRPKMGPGKGSSSSLPIPGSKSKGSSSKGSKSKDSDETGSDENGVNADFN
jgi:hypothetical protein